MKSGELKAAPSPFFPPTDDARKVMQDTIDDGFRWFVSLVETRRGIAAAQVPGLREGRIFSGREALTLKLVDEIGGEAEAVRWLEDKRGVAKDLKVIDWKPAREGSWGLSSAFLRVALESLGLGSGGLGGLVGGERIGRLGLDGLVSVWHPSEN